MVTILIASGNPHKHEEISRLLSCAGVQGVDWICPGDLDLPTPPPDPVEDGASYLENAEIKARAFASWSGLPALADDSGLEVDALGGAPGIHSARYAGPQADFAANIEKLLGALQGSPPEERIGRFVSALVLVEAAENGAHQVLYSTEGVCPGTVLEAPTGTAGFGYDPIFRPDGESRSFAEMTDREKDAMSHRGMALRAFANYLRQHPTLSGGAIRR